MDLGLTREEQDTVEIASQFARDHVAPNAAGWEAKREHPRAALEQAAAVGLVGLLVPKDLGGKGFSFTALVRILEELAYADVAFAFAVVVHNNLMFNIARNGNDEQRARFLPPLMAMDKVGCFMLTEPNAGSDATALQTRARRDGGNLGQSRDPALCGQRLSRPPATDVPDRLRGSGTGGPRRRGHV